ncbi:sensor histidine kinase [Trinickia acidisoli]|uniref:sensor histidine kinase n=1 Tax=Trinickia acidisoli TaxID=2767482 RepID=UPI001A8D7540|nr:ATP-binding protein [Trinickia acidisoli]
MRALVGRVRWRMTLWYSLSIALIYLVFAGCVFLTFRYGCIAESRLRLNSALTLVTSALAKTPDRMASIESDFPACNFYVAANRRVLYASTGWAATGIAIPVGIDSGGYAFRASASGRHYAIRETNIRLDGRPLRVGIAEDDQQTFENLERLWVVLLFSLPGLLLVSLPGGYWLAGRLLSPMDAMARKAKEITADDLSQRLTVGTQGDEFDRLACVFNETFDRLEDSFKRMRRFTGDASHELRTPLAVIRSMGENALKGPRDAVIYEDAIGGMLEETDRMTRLLEGLLTLTRAESERLPLVFDAVRLGEVSLNVVNCLRVLAEEKAQTLACHEEAELNVVLDKATFEQALINLVANAIQYTQAGGEITVRVRACPERGALVEVDDNGPGIAAEHRERIFERFYRIDEARSRAAGGSGLGLAIARWAIGLNGGTVDVEAKPDQGSIFRIALPSR